MMMGSNKITIINSDQRLEKIPRRCDLSFFKTGHSQNSGHHFHLKFHLACFQKPNRTSWEKEER